MNLMSICMVIFTLICNPVMGQWTDQNSGITNDLNDVFFLNSNNGWAVGRQGKIVMTSTGGTATWLAQNSGTTNDLNKVFMVNTNVGYAVGDNGTVIKYNGSTWSALNISYSQDMHGVYFLDANTGWVSGDWGRIMMTTDGGSTWTTQVNNAMYTNLFYDIHMVNSGDGWAVGTSGRVLHYNGSNWSNVSTPATGDLYSVSFSSSTNGIITGENSKVYYYNSGTITEHSTSLPDNSFHVYSVVSISPTLAYAATSPGFGGGGIILKYNGSSWTTDYEYTGIYTELFYGISFPVASKGFAVGAGGMIKTFGTSSDVNDLLTSINGFILYPNPSSGLVAVELENSFSQHIVISLYDISGKEIKTIYSGNLKSGIHTQLVDVSAIENGTYFIKITSERDTLTKGFLKI